jgi:hypothetical protein
MPAAKDKEALLAVTEAEYSKLCSLLENLPQRVVNTRYDDDTSVKDVVGHRAHWIALFLGWYRDGKAGKEVFFPSKGYKWNELKAYNKKVRNEQAGLSWQDAVSLLQSNSKK